MKEDFSRLHQHAIVMSEFYWFAQGRSLHPLPAALSLSYEAGFMPYTESSLSRAVSQEQFHQHSES